MTWTPPFSAIVRRCFLPSGKSRRAVARWSSRRSFTFWAYAARPLASDRWLGLRLESQNIKQRGPNLGPATRRKCGDERPERGSVDDSNPLGLNDTCAGQAVAFRQCDLPGEPADLRGQRNDRDLVQGGQHIWFAEHQHWAALVWATKAKPPDVSAGDHGNSGSPSSSMGPSGPCVTHAFQARPCSAPRRTSSSTNSKIG